MLKQLLSVITTNAWPSVGITMLAIAVLLGYLFAKPNSTANPSTTKRISASEDIALALATIGGIVFSSMLARDSFRGIQELLGREDAEWATLGAILLTACIFSALLVGAFAVGTVLRESSIPTDDSDDYNHRRSYDRHPTNRRIDQRNNRDDQSMNDDDSIPSCVVGTLDYTILEDGRAILMNATTSADTSANARTTGIKQHTSTSRTRTHKSNRSKVIRFPTQHVWDATGLPPAKSAAPSFWDDARPQYAIRRCLDTEALTAAVNELLVNDDPFRVSTKTTVKLGGCIKYEVVCIRHAFANTPLPTWIADAIAPHLFEEAHSFNRLLHRQAAANK